jgi:transcriptional regulator with XRE-family HTH domain
MTTDKHKHPRIAEESLGGRIKTLRKLRGLSQKKLATALRITSSAVSQWETGGTENIKLATFLSLCKVLNTTPERLIDGDVRSDGFWPFPFDRSEVADLDPVELELAGLKFQRVLDDIRAKRGARRTSKAP